MAVELFTTLGATSGTFISGGQLSGAPSDIYTLPDSLVLLDDSAASRFRETSPILSDGARLDGYVTDARDIVVTGQIFSADAPTQRALLDAILQKAALPSLCLRDEKLGTDRFIQVARSKQPQIQHKDLWGKRYTDVTLTFRAADPYWYATSYAQQIFGLTGNGTITVSVDSTIYRDVSPIIQVVAPAAAAVPSVRLTNTTDGGRFCLYEDTGLTSGAIATLDCTQGTAARGGVNTIRYFSGWWLRLLPGDNSITYEGDPCTLAFTWRGRWL